MGGIPAEWIVSSVVVLIGVAALAIARRRLIKTFGAEGYGRLSIFSADQEKGSNPIAEAEVYLRYGQQKKAIERLRQAHSEDPADVAVLAKLQSLEG